jgi:hypothetical protein
MPDDCAGLSCLEQKAHEHYSEYGDAALYDPQETSQQNT